MRQGGEKRGNSRNRRVRKLRMLADARFGGNGSTVPCVHCGRRQTYETVQADRIVPGGSYAYANVQPACGPCNRARGNGSKDAG